MDTRVLPFAVCALALAAFLTLLFRRQKGLISGGKGRLPKHFEVEEVSFKRIPEDAEEPLKFLTERLHALGFERASHSVEVTALAQGHYRVLLVPFAHESESALFFMGIESPGRQRAHLMLHIITPLSEGRRVETTTLEGLKELRQPPEVALQIVTEADSIDEVWSRHRRALAEHQRSERQAVRLGTWQTLAASAYEAWLRSAVLSQRLELEPSGTMYRLRPRPRRTV